MGVLCGLLMDAFEDDGALLGTELLGFGRAALEACADAMGRDFLERVVTDKERAVKLRSEGRGSAGAEGSDDGGGDDDHDEDDTCDVEQAARLF